MTVTAEPVILEEITTREQDADLCGVINPLCDREAEFVLILHRPCGHGHNRLLLCANHRKYAEKREWVCSICNATLPVKAIWRLR